MENDDHNYSHSPQPGNESSQNIDGHQAVLNVIVENEDHNYSNSLHSRIESVQRVDGLQAVINAYEDLEAEIQEDPDASADEVDGTDTLVPEHEAQNSNNELVLPIPSTLDGKRSADDTEEMDPGSLCTICYSDYDTGVHKLCCLKCGHLFGRSCIEHWLKAGCTSGNRKCPTCNTKAHMKDIRILYAKTLVATDTSELNRMKKKNEELTNEKFAVQSALRELTLRMNTKIDSMKAQIAKQDFTIKKLMSKLGPDALKNSNSNSITFSCNVISTAKLSDVGGCRVLAHSSHLSLLAASQASTNPTLFPGFGIRKINVHDMRPATYNKLHEACIRDISFGPYERSSLLSVSLDSTAKLFDVQSNVSVQTFKVPDPLWSCCWGPIDAYKIYCGSQNGSFYVFDRRYSRGEPEHVVKVPNHFTGFISLCPVPPKAGRFLPSGGILACRFFAYQSDTAMSVFGEGTKIEVGAMYSNFRSNGLNSVIAFYAAGNSYEFKTLPIEGNFLSLRYNSANDNVLISAKHNQTWKAPRHLVYQLSEHAENSSGGLDLLQTYYATKSPTVLSRSTFVPTPNGDQMICAYNDRNKSLDTWSMSTEKKLDASEVHLPDPILDICSFHNNLDEVTLPCISHKNLTVLKFKFLGDDCVEV